MQIDFDNVDIIEVKKQLSQDQYTLLCFVSPSGKGIDITNGYDEWLKVGMALYSEFGEGGRSYFHSFSRNFYKYDAQECDKKYSSFAHQSPHNITIATLFGMCKDHGITYADTLKSMGKSAAAATQIISNKKNPNTNKPYTQQEIEELHNFYTPKIKGEYLDSISISTALVLITPAKNNWQTMY